jgi:hypothetical protein
VVLDPFMVKGIGIELDAADVTVAGQRLTAMQAELISGAPP